jgi:hypothetical protein
MAVRRVRRVIRKFDPWTVLKVSFVFNAIGSLVFVLGTWVMWSLLVQRGIPDRIADLLGKLTISFTPDGELYFRIVVLLAVVWAVLMTGVMTLAAVLYNLISDMVGGVEVIVLEETLRPEPVVRQTAGGNGRMRAALGRIRPPRNPVRRRPEAAPEKGAEVAASRRASG